MEGVKVPDTTHTWLDETIGLGECRMKCLNNCSCMAYTNSDIRGEGSGCVMWFGDLIDIRQFENDGQDLYIRMDSSELGIHKDFIISINFFKISLYKYIHRYYVHFYLIFYFVLSNSTMKGNKKSTRRW